MISRRSLLKGLAAVPFLGVALTKFVPSMKEPAYLTEVLVDRATKQGDYSVYVVSVTDNITGVKTVIGSGTFHRGETDAFRALDLQRKV